MSEFEELEDDEWQPPTESELKVLQAKRERSNKISKLMGDYLLKGYKMLGVCCRTCDTILLQDKHGVNYCVACRELDADNVKDDPARSTEAALRQAAEEKEKGSSKKSSPTEQSEPLPGVSSISMAPALLSTSVEHFQSSASSRSLPDNLADTMNSLEPRHIFPAMRGALEQGPSNVNLVSPDLTRNTPRTGPVQVAQTRGCESPEIPVQESQGGVRPRSIDGQRHAARRDCHTVTCSPASRCSAHTDIVHRSLDILYRKLRTASTDLQQCADIRHCTDLCHMIKACTEAIESLAKLLPRDGGS